MAAAKAGCPFVNHLRVHVQGRYKQPACKSPMPPASLAPATAGPEEGFVPVFISPGLRLQGNLITCKLHLVFNESTPTPPNPNILLTGSSEHQISVSEKVRAGSDSQHGLEECEGKSSPSPTSTRGSQRPHIFCCHLVSRAAGPQCCPSTTGLLAHPQQRPITGT